MPTPKPHCKNALDWLTWQKHDLGVLTGQDRTALQAIAHCWELYARSDPAGELAAIEAVQALLKGMQPKCWPLAKALISQTLDWNAEDRVWQLVCTHNPQAVPPTAPPVHVVTDPKHPLRLMEGTVNIRTGRAGVTPGREERR